MVGKRKETRRAKCGGKRAVRSTDIAEGTIYSAEGVDGVDDGMYLFVKRTRIMVAENIRPRTYLLTLLTV